MRLIQEETLPILLIKTSVVLLTLSDEASKILSKIAQTLD